MKPYAMRGTCLPLALLLPFFRLLTLYRARADFLHTLRQFFFAVLIPLALASCTFVDGDSGKAAPPPSAAAQQQEKIPTAMDTFRALAPPEGFKFTPLFADTVKDEDARFHRLEQAVQDLRNDFDTVTPSLVRLVAVEKDMKELISQLQTLTKGPDVAAAPVVPVAPPSPIGYMNKIPGEDITGGTDSAAAGTAAAEAQVPSSLVTPEAASEGELPPEDAASPVSDAPALAAAQNGASPAAAQNNASPAATAETAPPAQQPSAEQAVEPPVDITWSGAQQQPAAPASQPYPFEKKADEQGAGAAPANKGPVLGDVKAVRIGDHLDKTRIVLDLTAELPYTARLENNGKRLVIELPQANWATARSWDAMSAALVASYSFDNGRVAMDLLYPSTIKAQSILPPNGSPYHRLVIDLHSSEVHE